MTRDGGDERRGPRLHGRAYEPALRAPATGWPASHRGGRGCTRRRRSTSTRWISASISSAGEQGRERVGQPVGQGRRRGARAGRRRPRPGPRRPSPTARCAAWAPRAGSPRGRSRGRPAPSRSTWPPLRSELLSDGVEDRHRAQHRLGAVGDDDGLTERGLALEDDEPPVGHLVGVEHVDQGSCSGSPATGPTHSWTEPGPSGPSRSTVGGTTPKPPASLTSQAARSRATRVPSG